MIGRENYFLFDQNIYHLPTFSFEQFSSFFFVIATDFLFFFLGIGSDDAFIIYNTWYNMSKEATNMPYIDLYYNVLKHASIAILVTCITTVAAFLTSIDSKITAVACFR